MDQGEEALDPAVSQTIRRIVVGDNTLSTNAHDIKISTGDGRVKLRGPLDNPVELTR